MQSNRWPSMVRVMQISLGQRAGGLCISPLDINGEGYAEQPSGIKVRDLRLGMLI